MWISRQINKAQQEPTVEKGKITLNKNGELEAVSTGVERNFEVFSPYGYSCNIPAGTDMLLTKCDGTQNAIGVKMQESNLELGEIKIAVPSGAYIYLKNDGSVVINGVVISKAGEINGKKY